MFEYRVRVEFKDGSCSNYVRNNKDDAIRTYEHTCKLFDTPSAPQRVTLSEREVTDWEQLKAKKETPVRDELQFEVTQDHLTLAKHMWVGWDDTEYGAPEIDPKRPYGNSDVQNDINEILKKDLDDAEAYELHKEMQTVLQIALVVGSFMPGHYVRDQYKNNWGYTHA